MASLEQTLNLDVIDLQPNEILKEIIENKINRSLRSHISLDKVENELSKRLISDSESLDYNENEMIVKFGCDSYKLDSDFVSLFYSRYGTPKSLSEFEELNNYTPKVNDEPSFISKCIKPLSVLGASIAISALSYFGAIHYLSHYKDNVFFEQSIKQDKGSLYDLYSKYVLLPAFENKIETMQDEYGQTFFSKTKEMDKKLNFDGLSNPFIKLLMANYKKLNSPIVEFKDSQIDLENFLKSYLGSCDQINAVFNNYFDLVLSNEKYSNDIINLSKKFGSNLDLNVNKNLLHSDYVLTFGDQKINFKLNSNHLQTYLSSDLNPLTSLKKHLDFKMIRLKQIFETKDNLKQIHLLSKIYKDPVSFFKIEDELKDLINYSLNFTDKKDFNNDVISQMDFTNLKTTIFKLFDKLNLKEKKNELTKTYSKLERKVLRSLINNKSNLVLPNYFKAKLHFKIELYPYYLSLKSKKEDISLLDLNLKDEKMKVPFILLKSYLLSIMDTANFLSENGLLNPKVFDQMLKSRVELDQYEGINFNSTFLAKK